MKNRTIMGGMLYVMAFGAGPLSLDARKGWAGAADRSGVRRHQRPGKCLRHDTGVVVSRLVQ